MQKEEAISYVNNVSIILIALTSFLFPLFFLTNTNDPFIFPKNILLVFVSLILLTLFALRAVIEKRITIRTSPFNIPILLLGVIFLASAFFSPNVFDSLLQVVPILAVFIFYFTTLNVVSDKNTFRMVLYSLILGSVLVSVISLFQFFGKSLFPFELTADRAFNPFGSLLQMILYQVPLFGLCLYYIYKDLRTNRNVSIDYNFIIYAIGAVGVGIGILIASYQIIISPQKPIILPFNYGFQIALASISQDAERIMRSFLLGSGYGTFLIDFTRFKLPSFNLERDIWNLAFSYSSSYFLELVATTGILGTLSYIFLTFKVIRAKVGRQNALYLAAALLLLLSFLLPFSYTSIFLLFVLLALYAVELYTEKKPSVHNVTVSLVAFREGLFTISADASRHHTTPKDSPALPIILLVLVLGTTGFVGYFTAQLLTSDIKFRESFNPANLNDGAKVYRLQAEGLAAFPYKGDYHRVFSQINFALANSLLNNVPQGSSPAADLQTQVFQLIQQSINSGRNASIISPQTSVNWQNLSQIYRNLINVGQNAESFSVATLNQAIRLDPTNPQLYIELGGIYFQLGQYENAQTQFALAAQLKRDFANAYYNLAYAFRAKNDLANALNQLQIARQLIQDNPEAVKKLDEEIAALRTQIGGAQVPGEETPDVNAQTNQPPLQISSPSANLPAQRTPLEIPPPPTSTESAR